MKTNLNVERDLKIITTKLQKAMTVANYRGESDTLAVLETYREIITNNYPMVLKTKYDQTEFDKWYRNFYLHERTRTLVKVPILYWLAIAHNRRTKSKTIDHKYAIMQISLNGEAFWLAKYKDCVKYLINDTSKLVLKQATNNQLEKYADLTNQKI